MSGIGFVTGRTLASECPVWTGWRLVYYPAPVSRATGILPDPPPRLFPARPGGSPLFSVRPSAWPVPLFGLPAAVSSRPALQPSPQAVRVLAASSFPGSQFVAWFAVMIVERVQ